METNERWAVHYIDGDGSDDWQLMMNNHTKYFYSLEEAKTFAAKYIFTKKPKYWQPAIWREIEYQVTSNYWKRADSFRTNLDNEEKCGDGDL